MCEKLSNKNTRKTSIETSSVPIVDLEQVYDSWVTSKMQWVDVT